MVDPLAQIIGRLQPSASFSKLMTATSPWAVRPPGEGPFYAALLDGEVELTVGDDPPVELGPGAFVLIPAGDEFTVTSLTPPPGLPLMEPVETSPGIFHLGDYGPADARMLIGYCAFRAEDAALLVSLLPRLVVVYGERRLTILVELLSEEARGQRPGRDVILERLLEVLLIESLRATSGTNAPPGLLRGLADDRIAIALRRMHGDPARPWTIGQLAQEAALSRSTFFDRFRREVGIAPMEYLLSWRVTLAKDMLCYQKLGLVEVAAAVGYSSSSTFSTAFTRHVGVSPARYARTSRQDTKQPNGSVKL